MDETRPQGTSHHRARSASWSIHTDDPQLRQLLDDIFGDLVGSSSPAGTRFAIERSPEAGQLLVTQDEHSGALPAVAAIDRLVGFLNKEVLSRASGTLDLHASAVTDGASGLTIMTTAPSGGGKTTIAANLCRRGWSYLSDETVGIKLDDGSLVGCGKPLTVKHGLHATLGIDLAPLTLDAANQQRWYVRPSLLGGSVAAAAPPPTDLVFINFDESAAQTEVHPVAPHQALIQLLSNTYELERHGASVLPTLARLVASVRAWQLDTNDGTQAVDELLRAVSNTARPDHEVLHHPAADAVAATTGPAPAAGTTFAGFAGAGGVVYDHVRSQAVLLDPIGTVVWQALDGTVSVAELAADLAPHFDAPASTIAADVETLCTDLATQGFLVEP